MVADSNEARCLLPPSPEVARQRVEGRCAMFRRALAGWCTDVLRYHATAGRLSDAAIRSTRSFQAPGGETPAFDPSDRRAA